MIVNLSRFQIATEHQTAFEDRWKNAGKALEGVDGFAGFDLLRTTPEEGNGVVFMAQVRWESTEKMEAWRNNGGFQSIMGDQQQPPQGMHLQRPSSRIFDVIS